MARLPARLYADLIGKPYRRDARGPDAYDCLGLVLEVQQRLGHRVPDYLSDEVTLHRELSGDTLQLGQACRVAQPEPGDVVLLRIPVAVGPRQHHVAVMLDAWTMLNTREGCNATVERLLAPTWSGRIVGFYRLPKDHVVDVHEMVGGAA